MVPLFPPGPKACIPPSLLSQGLSPLFPSTPNNPGNLLNPEGTVQLTHPHHQPFGRKDGNRQPSCLGEQEAWAGAVARSMGQIAVLHPLRGTCWWEQPFWKLHESLDLNFCGPEVMICTGPELQCMSASYFPLMGIHPNEFYSDVCFLAKMTDQNSPKSQLLFYCLFTCPSKNIKM